MPLIFANNKTGSRIKKINAQLIKNEDFSCSKTLICCIYPTNKCYNVNNCWHYNIYGQDKIYFCFV